MQTAALQPMDRVLLGGGQLEHGVRPGAAYDPTRRDGPMHLEHSPLSVEKHQVQPEAHAEGVHTVTARDQDSRPGALAPQQGQADQAAHSASGHGHLETEQLGSRERSKPEGHLHFSEIKGGLAPAEVSRSLGSGGGGSGSATDAL